MDSELINKWIEYHSTKDKSLYWAWEALDEIVQNSPDEALSYILEIATSTNNQEVLSNLGAGPLEDFLALYGANYIEHVETKARQVPQFTIVVKSVWQNSIEQSVWERVCAIQARHSQQAGVVRNAKGARLGQPPRRFAPFRLPQTTALYE